MKHLPHRPSRLLLSITLMLGACVPGPSNDMPTRAAQDIDGGLPPMKTFVVPRPVAPQHSNRDIARDFIELSFRLESGRDLPVLTRFEGPISVAVTGSPPPHLIPDLNRLLHRLKTEAGLNIHLSNADTANITIQAVPRREIRKALPQAACFVVPNITRLSQYRAAQRTQRVNWAALKERHQLAIFLPSDASPQEARDCLHEELAQALGPLNDLYHLPDSVFNDDNVHTVLTGFDMLILRTYYSRDLHSGMTRHQVAARLPAILARINPSGAQFASRPLSTTPRQWINAVQAALGPGAGPIQRRASAQQAVQIAQTLGWQDHRRAFSHYALGRLTQAADPVYAFGQFATADRFYAMTPTTGLHRAHVAAQMAIHALASGRGEDALRLIGPHIQTAATYENAALLATLLLLRAEALDLTGRVSEGRTVRLDSLGWARYGFGADWAVRAKMREISGLNPLKGRGG